MTEKSGVQPEDLKRLFDGASQSALLKAANRLGNEFTTQITSNKWDWRGANYVTKRKNGSEVTQPRNIVDLGNLRKSQFREQTGKYQVKWTWQVDYSALVHEGGRLKKGGEYPARPWTKHAEDEVKPLEYFADILRRELDG